MTDSRVVANTPRLHKSRRIRDNTAVRHIGRDAKSTSLSFIAWD